MAHHGPRRRLHLVADQASLAARLNTERLSSGLTQVELAERFGIRPQTLSAWEQGSLPQPRFYPAIADFLGLSSEDAVKQLVQKSFSGASSPALPSQPIDPTVAAASSVPDRPTAPLGDDMAALRAAFVDRIQQGPLTREESALFQQFLNTLQT